MKVDKATLLEREKIDRQSQKVLAEIKKMSPEEKRKLKKVANGFAEKCKSQGV